MASINTLPNLTKYGFVRVIDTQDEHAVDFPLYNASAAPNDISVVSEGFVIDNKKYNMYLALDKQTSTAGLGVSINGDEVYSPSSNQELSRAPLEKGFSLYEVPLSGNASRPFSLTFGFARIVISLPADNDEDELILTTRDIPCQSRDIQQIENISKMLVELLEPKNDAASEWMFSGVPNDIEKYSILDGAFQNDAPKSLNSFLQLIESVSSELERSADFFRLHAYSRIRKTSKKVPLREMRKAGSKELLWLAHNTEYLSESSRETGIEIQGRYYTPRYIETEKREKTFNNYENRLVLGFAEEVQRSSEALLRLLSDKVSNAQTIESSLRLLTSDNATLPALALVDLCLKRESEFIKRLENDISKLRRINRLYSRSLPHVVPLFPSAPKQTKVFQEIEAYSRIFRLITKWLNYGDFSLARENLALHTLRTDKLYEYFVLQKILEWLNLHGFEKNSEVDKPIQNVEYSLRNIYFTNETRVASLYNLQKGETKLSLYYQPVIYGAGTEEHGIKLHRLSATNSFKAMRKQLHDSYWTPDYLLTYNTGENTNTVILDAKYRTTNSVCEGYPQKGALAECISKYKTDTGAELPCDEVSAVWLLCGRDLSPYCQAAEQSSWSRSRPIAKSGVGVLSSSANALTEIFDHIFPPDVMEQASEGSYLVPARDKSGQLVRNIASQRYTLCKEAKRDVQHLWDTLADTKCLFDAAWTQSNLNFNHPLLRKNRPKGRESRFYIPIQLGEKSVYMYSNWLPNNINRIESLLSKLN